MNTLHQLTKMANIYYIIISGLQMIRPISVTGGYPTNAVPLLFVIFVSMVKDYAEDRVRQKSDIRENSSTTRVLRQGQWQDTCLLDLKVGDIVKVLNGEMFPADLVLLQTSNDSVCFVETKNIDGETNLKLKAAVALTTESDFESLRGARIECDNPNDRIYSFQGTLEHHGQVKALQYENFTLRGFTLKDTQFVIGTVVYVGQETKVMMNLTTGR
jgi:magnesium-transporting ATPase (P-type)